MSQTPDYDGREIKILLPPEAVRTRPKMYIGSTDHRGLHVLLRFTVESLLSHYTFLGQPLDEIMIRLEDDGNATLTCNGPTISAAFLERSAQALERELQAQTVRTSLFIVNALCERLVVTRRGSDNHWRSLLFEQGVFGHDEELTSPPNEDGDIWLRLWPDLTILESGVFDYQATVELMRPFSDSDPALTITVIDARSHTA